MVFTGRFRVRYAYDPKLVNKKRVYPYLVKLSMAGKIWHKREYNHKIKTAWLKENIGTGNKDWFCNEAGWYYFKDETSAMAFKLVWI
jgi:hypothetical protein